jgi:mutator protein MutT
MPDDGLWPVSIKGVVFVDEKVVLLLNDRAEWELPGGRLERGETPEACVRRELKEELGRTVAVDRLLLAEVLEALPQKFVLIVAYYCLLPAQTAEFKLSEEHKEVRLFSISELSQIPIPDVNVKAVKLTQRALT